MNTADITCIKITENIYKCSQNTISAIELHTLDDDTKKHIKWYDRVYLCCEGKQVNTSVKGFNCFRFSNTTYLWMTIDKRYTMIPICKWVPEIFDRHILKWKLKNGGIRLYR